MTNNQFCSVLGIFGCLFSFIFMVLMFFGVPDAIGGVIAGFLFAGISLLAYD